MAALKGQSNDNITRAWVALNVHEGVIRRMHYGVLTGSRWEARHTSFVGPPKRLVVCGPRST